MVLTGENLVFLVGCPRSGTTWLQKLLASHPQIRSGAESHFFSLYIGPQLRAWKMQQTECFKSDGYAAGPPAYFSEEEFLAILKTQLGSLLRPVSERTKPGELFLDKTPSHGLFIAEIKELLPGSRFIHLLRDPRDVVVSLLAASRAWGASWAPGNLDVALAMWLQHVRAVRDSAKDMSDREFLEITYERLWQSPVTVLSDIAQFLKVLWDETAIQSAIEMNRSDVLESGGTPIPVYGDAAARRGNIAKLPRGFVRKARPNAWNTELSAYEKYKVWRTARSVMTEMGYAWSFRDWF